MARRSVGGRTPKKRIFIVCGAEETEYNYFNEFLKELAFPGNLVKVDVLKSRRGDPINAVKKAIKCCEMPIDEAWAVVDKDDFTEFEAAYALAKKKGINIALSSICFENWILAHFTGGRKAFLNCDKVIEAIIKGWLPDYEKTDIKIYCKLRDRLNDAIRNAKTMRADNLQVDGVLPAYRYPCYTNVDELVEILRDYRTQIKK